ncbi:MAG: hypothetical protein U0270_13115 [Labilithrix sp.]
METETDVEPVAGESALASQRPRLLGLIDAGDVKSGYYYTPPQPRAWAFHAKAGDTITIDVQSNVGDAVAYLTDDRYNVLSYNDDFRQTTRNAQIVYTLPANTEVTSYRIVFADYDALPAPFDVALAVEAGGTCTVGSTVYHVGDHFVAPDGCNTCSCTTRGIDCSKKVCACNPGGEPDKIYMYTPDQCVNVHVTCSAGLEPFWNDCGCGCRRP